MAETITLSVRGEARRTIAPDFVVLQCGLSTKAGSKADALALLHADQQRLVGALTGLGGAPLTVENRRHDLTWSTGSISTHEEHDFDKRTGEHGPTGRVIASAHVVVVARDPARLDDLGRALAAVERLNVDSVSWQVDADNDQWRGVRADAIAAALAKGRDYAAALGGTVARVEHVADAGLLTPGAMHVPLEMSRAFAVSGGGDDFGTPSLDPVPQDISAVVEARLVAEIPPDA